MAVPAQRTRNDVAHWDTASEFDRLTQQMSQLFQGQWPDLPSLLGSDGFTPLADLEETDDAYLLEIELPGVKKKDINIDVEDRRIVISGERPEQKRTGWLRRQNRSWGRFRYEVVLPDPVDEDGIEATLDDGVLHVRVPKSSARQRRHVEVK
ncbi:Hsp20/alpha crystallin family protein [Kribbella sp. NPDC004536]|uniref:Hsp20/alpha crystallin family protein n=1 Tax=Kribbella sp. NPDC004536 TaxID=3364106 RepID=UPI00368B7418